VEGSVAVSGRRERRRRGAGRGSRLCAEIGGGAEEDEEQEQRERQLQTKELGEERSVEEEGERGVADWCDRCSEGGRGEERVGRRGTGRPKSCRLRGAVGRAVCMRQASSAATIALHPAWFTGESYPRCGGGRRGTVSRSRRAAMCSRCGMPSIQGRERRSGQGGSRCGSAAGRQPRGGAWRTPTSRQRRRGGGGRRGRGGGVVRLREEEGEEEREEAEQL
jgi:hypothetical protein